MTNDRLQRVNGEQNFLLQSLSQQRERLSFCGRQLGLIGFGKEDYFIPKKKNQTICGESL